MTVKDVFAAFAAGTKYTTKGSRRGRNQLAIQYDWTGDLATAVTLWASNHDDPTVADDTDWVDVSADVTLTAPAGVAGKFMVQVGNANARWYRLKFVRSGGSGTLTVRVEHLPAANA